jgi:hypothetical protein
MNGIRIGAIAAVAAACALPAVAYADEAKISISETSYDGQVFAAQMVESDKCGSFYNAQTSEVPGLKILAERKYKPKAKGKTRRPPRLTVSFEDGETQEPPPATGEELPPLQDNFGKFNAFLNGPSSQRMIGSVINQSCSPQPSGGQLSCNIDTDSTPMQLSGTAVGYRSFGNDHLNVTIEFGTVIKGISNVYTPQAVCGEMTGSPLINGDAFHPCRATLRLRSIDNGDRASTRFECREPTLAPFRDSGLDPSLSGYTAAAKGEIALSVK